MYRFFKSCQHHSSPAYKQFAHLFFTSLFTMFICGMGFRAESQTTNRAQNYVTPLVVQASATVTDGDAPSITLHWPVDSQATSYTVSRKRLSENVWYLAAQYGSATAGSLSSYEDDNVGVGDAYEYQIVKTSGNINSPVVGYGYVYAGIDVPMTDARPTIILVVDRTVVTPMASDPSIASGAYVNVAAEKNAVKTGINTLTSDLIGDGWRVVYVEVGRQNDPAAHGAELTNDLVAPTTFPVNLNAGNAAARKAGILEVRTAIQAAYNADPSHVKAVMLIGHVPVPYSGYGSYDGHPDHYGAWPADAYYGSITDWTDNTDWTQPGDYATGGGAAGPTPTRIRNYAGDGKFDPSVFPTALRLQVGRVDFGNMGSYNYPYQTDDTSLTSANYATASGLNVLVPAQPIPGFQPKDEYALLAQYFSKDHRFRNGDPTMQPTNSAIVSDYFYGGQLSSLRSGWSNFASLFGSDVIASEPSGLFFMSAYPAYPGQYPASDPVPSYLWSYGAGPGYSYIDVGGEGTLRLLGIDQNGVFTSYYPDAIPNSGGFFSFFPRVDPKVVFNISLASFTGDYDNEAYWGGNFLRAKIATSFGLTNVWDGGFYHQMGLGQTIGACEILTQNNGLAPAGIDANSSYDSAIYKPENSAGRITKELIGDPTLRMFPVLPPSNLVATISTVSGKDSVLLRWTPSPDTSAKWYAIYRAPFNSATGQPAAPYTRLYDPLGKLLFTSTSFTDKPPIGSYVYMLRAVKLQKTASGTFYNPSEGAFTASSVTVGTTAALALRYLTATADNVTLDNTGKLSFTLHVTNPNNLDITSLVLTGAIFQTSGSAALVTPTLPLTLAPLSVGGTEQFQMIYTGVSLNDTWYGELLTFNITDSAGRTNRVTASAPITKPFVLTGRSVNNGTLLQWTPVPGATDYTIYGAATPNVVAGDKTLVADVSGGTTTYTDPTNHGNAPYYYRIYAYYGNTFTISNELQVLTSIIDLVASSNNTSIHLSWSAIPGATGYNVYRGVNSDVDTSHPYSTATTNSADDPNVTKGVIYSYRVTATGLNSESDFSNIARAIIRTTVSSGPVTVAGSIALAGISDFSTISPGAFTNQFMMSFTPEGASPNFAPKTMTVTTTHGSAVAKYTVSGLPVGLYDLTITSASSAPLVIPNVYLFQNATIPGVALLSTRTTDSTDFSILIGAFGSVYDPANPNSNYDSRVDYNYDGSIDSSDFSIYIGNSSGPGGQTLSGNIPLDALAEGAVTAFPVSPIAVTFTNQTTGAIAYTAYVNLSTLDLASFTGYPYTYHSAYTLANAPASGTYNVAFSSNKTLIRKIFGVTIGANTVLTPRSLLSGDITQNNVYNQADDAIFNSAYNTVYDPTDLYNGYDPRADFNYDGSIDSTDFGIPGRYGPGD